MCLRVGVFSFPPPHVFGTCKYQTTYETPKGLRLFLRGYCVLTMKSSLKLMFSNYAACFVYCILPNLPFCLQGMVNGTRGVVTGFVQPRELHDRLSLGHGSATKLPKVRFSLPNGDNIEKLILPVKWP